MNFKDYITVIEDYPEKGIRFKDITTLMQNGPVYREAIDHMIEFAGKHDVDVIVGPEARGFVVGCPVAYAMEKAFVPIRKEGKLPRETITENYGLEYGEASLSIHTDAIKPGQRVLITDDLLATGGTVRATVQLVEKLGGVVAGLAFFIELSYLDARNNKDLNGYNVYSLVTFD